MKRLFAVLLLAAILCSSAILPVQAASDDWIIDEFYDPFPADTVIAGDLILTDDCPETVVLINTRIEGSLIVKTRNTVTVHFQGNSTCHNARLSGKTRIVGGKFDEILSETTFFSFQNATAQSVTLTQPDSLLTTTGWIGTVTVKGEDSIVGGSGWVENLMVDATGFTELIRSGTMEKSVTDDPAPAITTSRFVKASFNINPVVSPADSVVRASITFDYVPTEKQGDYRIYWYIGETLSDYDWHFTLEPGAVATLERSIHFDGVMTEAPVWIRLVSNAEDDNTVLKFATKVRCQDYSTAAYDAIEASSNPYRIDLIRNQNTVIVYGLDSKGEYSKIVNVFPCSTGYFAETELGNFEIGLQMRWGSLMGDLYGQFCSQFNNNQLFHSVPYYSKEPDDLEYDQYEHLGDSASSGCVRLAVADARWIYYHCYSGTPVRVYDSDTLPVVKPIPVLIREDSLNRGWDPTDPDPENPTRGHNPPKMLVQNFSDTLRPVPQRMLN